jgi:hypothetical protein
VSLDAPSEWLSLSLRGANGSRERTPDDRLREEAIHLSFFSAPKLDCFAEPVIGPRFARTRWLAMTKERTCADAGMTEPLHGDTLAKTLIGENP